LPFFDHRTHFVMGKIHAVEVRQILPWTVIKLNFLHAVSSFCRSARLTLKHTTLEVIRWNFGSLSPCEERFFPPIYLHLQII
jgi:hypothetical protein